MMKDQIREEENELEKYNNHKQNLANNRKYHELKTLGMTYVLYSNN